MIVDTGVIYADIDRSDDWHTSAAALLSTAPGPLRVPALVVTEVCYLLQVRLGPVASDLPLGAVDASVMAVAERLGDRDVATTDRRHFYAVAEARGFTLHPAV